MMTREIMEVEEMRKECLSLLHSIILINRLEDDGEITETEGVRLKDMLLSPDNENTELAESILLEKRKVYTNAGGVQ